MGQTLGIRLVLLDYTDRGLYNIFPVICIRHNGEVTNFNIRNSTMYRISVLTSFMISCLAITGCRKASSSGSSGGTVKKDVPGGMQDGVNFLNGGRSVLFDFYAPKKNSVSVIGEFTNWQPVMMTNSTDGNRWWVQVDSLDPTKEYAYQYLVDGSLRIADPYTEKILDPNNDQYIPASTYPNLKAYPSGGSGIVSTFYYSQPSYSWQNNNFQRPEAKNLIIYELLVRDFVATHDYKTIKDTLNYFTRLGVNAIELMPFSEFEGNDSWGYNPDFYFAPDKYYGTKNDLKALIDACHGKGIAVIQDIVLNHSFGSSPMVQLYWNGSAPSGDNPWYNTVPTHPYNVGYQFNHENAATKYFVKNVLKWWMTEYHIDGFRFDLAKGFTQFNSGTDVNLWSQYDASRVAIWKDYYNYIRSIDPSLYVILEFFGSNQEEGELTTLGMLTWKNLATPGEQATMGYNDAGGSWDISGLFYDRYGFTNPYAAIAYFESHDEERLQFKNEMYGNSSGGYNIKLLPTGLKRDEMGAAFMFSSPGPKMIWEFGEMGYDISINGFGGRLNPKPPHWEYLNDPNRASLFNIYSKMIRMKIKNNVFTTTGYSYDLGQAVKIIHLNGTGGIYVIIVGNFDVVQNNAVVNFPLTGNWTDNINGAILNVNTQNFPMTLQPGEYHVFSNQPLQQ